LLSQDAIRLVLTLDRETDRQTETETETDRDRDRDRESNMTLLSITFTPILYNRMRVAPLVAVGAIVTSRS